jgi:hypothetical protein
MPNRLDLDKVQKIRGVSLERRNKARKNCKILGIALALTMRKTDSSYANRVQVCCLHRHNIYHTFFERAKK